MEKLNSDHFPVACCQPLMFQTSDGKIRKGEYNFNHAKCRRWIDEINNEFTSADVIEWEYLIDEKESEDKE